MKLFQWADKRIKKLTLIDVKLFALAGMAIGIILAKLIPCMYDINIWWFVLIGGVSLIRVYYVIFFAK